MISFHGFVLLTIIFQKPKVMEPPVPRFGYLEPHTTFPLLCSPTDAFESVQSSLATVDDVDIEEVQPDRFKLRCTFNVRSRVVSVVVRIFTRSPNDYVLEVQRRSVSCDEVHPRLLTLTRLSVGLRDSISSVPGPMVASVASTSSHGVW